LPSSPDAHHTERLRVAVCAGSPACSKAPQTQQTHEAHHRHNTTACTRRATDTREQRQSCDTTALLPAPPALRAYTTQSNDGCAWPAACTTCPAHAAGQALRRDAPAVGGAIKKPSWLPITSSFLISLAAYAVGPLSCPSATWLVSGKRPRGS